MKYTSSIAALALVSIATSQDLYIPNIGAAQNSTDDLIIAGLPLGFPFTFPDGTVRTSVDVDSNGRVLIPGSDPTDFTETLGEMLAGPSAIYPFWQDLNPNGTHADDIYFNALPNVAVITWKDVVLFNQAAPFTFQCQLHSDGRITFVYDVRTPLNDPIVGVAVGNGTANPGASDLSTVVTSASATVFEDFDAAPFDLAGLSVEFVPVGPGGGWVILTGPAGIASTTGTGPSCRRSIDLLPDGSGGYVVAHSSSFEPNFGASLGMAGDDAVAGPFALGFTFPMPGGTMVSSVDLDINPRILPPGSDGSDFSPSSAEFYGEPHATIAPLWVDLNLNSIGGDILLATRPGSATFTWREIAQFRGSVPLTVQATLRQDGSMTFSYVDTTGWIGSIGSDTIGGLTTALVGVTAGGLVGGPAEVDFSTPTLIGGTNFFEFWDSVDLLDLQLTTVAVSPPTLGSNFDVRVVGIPPGSLFVSLLFGFDNPDLDLDPVPIGLPGCFLLTTPIVPAIPLPFTGSESGVFSLPVSLTSTSLIGVSMFLQSATITPGATPFDFVLGSGLEARVGR